VFQTVPGNAETLIKWPEHLFRYLFQTHVAAGAFMPSQESGTEHLILGGVPVFRRRGLENLSVESFRRRERSAALESICPDRVSVIR
jgi:hypothetical protein